MAEMNDIETLDKFFELNRALRDGRESHNYSAWMRLRAALSAPSQGPAAWLDAGSSPLARGTAASGPRREALALAITDYSTGAESISYTVDRVLALLGEAPPKASEAEHPSPNSSPGATVQPQARPMKLRAEVWAKYIKVIQEDEIGDFLVFRWDIVGSDARKAAEEIAYRINSFEPQAEGGAE